MDFVKVALGRREGLASVAFTDVGKLSNGGTRLGTLDKSRVLGRLAKVIVVAEATVDEEVIDLLRGSRAGSGAFGGRTPAKMKTRPRREVTQSFDGEGDTAQAE